MHTLGRHRSQTTLGDAAHNFEITHKSPIWNPLPNYNRNMYNPIGYNSSASIGMGGPPSTTKNVLQTMAQNNILR